MKIQMLSKNRLSYLIMYTIQCLLLQDVGHMVKYHRKNKRGKLLLSFHKIYIYFLYIYKYFFNSVSHGQEMCDGPFIWTSCRVLDGRAFYVQEGTHDDAFYNTCEAVMRNSRDLFLTDHTCNGYTTGLHPYQIWKYMPQTHTLYVGWQYSIHNIQESGVFFSTLKVNVFICNTT